MGRPPKFSRSQLQAAALALVDEQGLAGLSMRALAAKLGTGAMTLYNHVADRADLEVLVVDAVVSEVRLPRTRAEDWRAEVRAIATAMWRAVRVHPQAIPLIATRRTRSPAALAFAESLLAALSRSGRSGRDLLIAFRAVSAFVLGFAQAELAGPLAAASGEPGDAVVARMRALPRDRYPRMVEVATAAAKSDVAREFRSALDVLIAGLAVGAATRAHRSSRRTTARTPLGTRRTRTRTELASRLGRE
jgi:AcrR family transcriptional regulator